MKTRDFRSFCIAWAHAWLQEIRNIIYQISSRQHICSQSEANETKDWASRQSRSEVSQTWSSECCEQYIFSFVSELEFFFYQEMLTLRTWTEKTFISVQDQLFDHKLDVIEYYLDQDVQVDTKVCFLKRFFNEMMQKMIRLVSLTADLNASTELLKKQKAEFRNHSKIICLSNRNKTFTAQLKLQSYKLISTTKETSLYNQKMRAQARLNSFKVELRHSMIEKSRKRHFRKIDTIVFDLQFSVSSNQKNSMFNESA